MLVSVIIPVYNVDSYLIETLDSVINQTYKNLEILIIDDGSEDNSGKICDEYSKIDNRIRVIHQENKGLSIARNVGIEMMTGDVVAFLDSDDVYHYDCIKRMVEAMSRYDSDIVVCKYSTVVSCQLEKEIPTPAIKPSITPGIYNRFSAIQALYYRTINVTVWNKIYKRRLWDNIRFSAGHVFEDNEIAYKTLSLSDSICVIDDVLYTHRRRVGSITTTPSLKNYKDQILACSRVEDFIRSNVPIFFSKEQLKAVEGSRISQMISVYILSSSGDSDWDTFREELRRSIIARSAEIELKKVRIRVACVMIRFCPWMLKPLYSLYLPLRGIVLNVTGK